MFFNPSISRGQVVFNNYLEQAVEEHPLPWLPVSQVMHCDIAAADVPLLGECANLVNSGAKEWSVVASDNFTVVRGCADPQAAQAIINLAYDTCFDDVSSRFHFTGGV